MANTRPFTYNPGPTIPGNNQIGDLAYGNLNDVNGGPDYSGDPGGEKWWMGPDEDNRYIIAKDIPTSDWPTPVPEGDIGSVRFWSSNENDNSFTLRVNTLPARIGMDPFTEPRSAYNWLITNYYWTNYDYNANEGVTYITYNTPDVTADSNITGKNNATTRNFVYDSNNNRLIIAGEQDNDKNPQYGNFYISDFSNSLSISSSIFYSGSSYASYYLPSTTSSTTDTNDGENIGQGYIAIDNVNEEAYVLSNPVSNRAGGLIKYDLSNNTVIWTGPSNYSVPRVGTVELDKSGDFLWIGSRAVLSGFIANTSNGRFRTFITQKDGSSASDVSFAQITPGPNNKAMALISTNSDITAKYVILTGSLSPTPSAKMAFSQSVSASTVFEIMKPIYVSSKNKWYVPYPGFNSQNQYNYLAVVDGNTNQITDTIEFGYAPGNSGNRGEIDFCVYDSDRDYIWTNTAHNQISDRRIVAIDLDTNSEVISSNSTYIGNYNQTSRRYNVGVYLDNYILFYGTQTFSSEDRSVVQKIRVDTIINQ